MPAKTAEFRRRVPGFCPECSEWLEIHRVFTSSSVNAHPVTEEITCGVCGFHWLWERGLVLDLLHGTVWLRRQEMRALQGCE